MKVYLVVNHVDYEGYDLYSVGKDKEACMFRYYDDAVKYCEKMTNEKTIDYEDWEVIEFEVK